LRENLEWVFGREQDVECLRLGTIDVGHLRRHDKIVHLFGRISFCAGLLDAEADLPETRKSAAFTKAFDRSEVVGGSHGG
jgi:hypothetical protein